MSQKSSVPAAKAPAERVVRDTRRAAHKQHSAEDKIRIALGTCPGGYSRSGRDAAATRCRDRQLLVARAGQG
jgi:hypothetical protein